MLGYIVSIIILIYIYPTLCLIWHTANLRRFNHNNFLDLSHHASIRFAYKDNHCTGLLILVPVSRYMTIIFHYLCLSKDELLGYFYGWNTLNNRRKVLSTLNSNNEQSPQLLNTLTQKHQNYKHLSKVPPPYWDSCNTKSRK